MADPGPDPVALDASDEDDEGVGSEVFGRDVSEFPEDE